MIDGKFRDTFERGMRPVGRNLRDSGVTADQLTVFGGVMAVCTAVALGAGNLRVAFVFGVLAAIPDVLDGAVAKASGTTSARGAFFDSVMDRVADALVFGGVALYLMNHAADPRWALLPMALLGTSMLISYERARAEALGFDARGGLMERAERLILLGIAFLFEVVLIPVLVVMLVLTTITVVQRFANVWRQASVERPVSPSRRRRRARRRAARSTRWRTRTGGDRAIARGSTWRTRRPRD